VATVKKKFENVDDYINSFPENVRKILRTVQKTIKNAVPEAEELISYQIPAFKSKKVWIFYYSAYASHYALSCPPPFTVFEKYKNELSEFEVSTSSVKFPFGKPVPAKLIAEMAKFRQGSGKTQSRKSRRE
jgi:uncharacterized protein YdhG (YjbR/CyaY superfamily)